MKKWMILLALALVACTKITEQTITVCISGIETGSMTKVDPFSVFAATAPTSIPELTLQSNSISARRYTVSNGEAVSVPLDTYTVTGEYSPNQTGAIQGGKVFLTPPYSVNASITVTEGKDSYTVPAAYTCFALVLDAATTEKYRTRNPSGSYIDLNWMAGDAVKVAYIQGQWEFPALPVIVVPKDIANYETTTFGLVTNKDYSGVFVEYGKWYCFGPKGVTTSGGNIGVEIPEWICGN